MMQNAQEGYGTEESDRGGGSVVLETRGLRKVYGSGEKCLAVLMDANLILRRGEMVAIVAPSGAGKSTLLHLLAALDTPTSGTVYFATKAIETNDDAALSEFRNRAVGFLWQRHQLLPDFTAAENVAMPLLLRGDNFAAAQGMARKWLAEVGLESGRSPGRGTLRRGTAACRDCPGARHRAVGAAGRRAHRRSRRAERLGSVRITGTASPHAQVDVADRDAQSCARRAV
jgi:ABC-type sugar transport system ATPase subunit